MFAAMLMTSRLPNLVGESLTNIQTTSSSYGIPNLRFSLSVLPIYLGGVLLVVKSGGIPAATWHNPLHPITHDFFRTSF
jgi:hypothetical protein